MNQHDELDRTLIDWLAEESPRDTSARVTRAALSEARRTRRLRPLPTFLQSLMGDPMETTWRPPALPLARPAMTFLLLLLAAVLATGVAIVGSRLLVPSVLPAVLLASPAPVGGGLVAWDSAGDIWVGTADGAMAAPVTSDPAREIAPSWAPDGRRIAYWRFADADTAMLVVRDLVDGSTLDITSVERPYLSDPGGGPSWSPDGTLVAWASGPQPSAVIGIAKADGSAPPAALALPDLGVYDPLFSPDGTRLSFAARRTGNLIALHVGDVAADGIVTDPREVSHDSLVFPDPGNTIHWQGAASFGRSDWSPDGAWILTSAGTTYGIGGSLLVAPDGTRQSDPTGGRSDLGWGTWSPDGTRIAYLRHVADNPEQAQLLVSGLGDADAQTVAGLPLVNSLPAWSPDGTRIAVRDAHGEAVVIAPADGGDPFVTIPATEAVGDPVFQPVPVALPGILPAA